MMILTMMLVVPIIQWKIWTKEELIKLGDICINNNIIIISDEIHCDLTLKT